MLTLSSTFHFISSGPAEFRSTRHRKRSNKWRATLRTCRRTLPTTGFRLTRMISSSRSWRWVCNETDIHSSVELTLPFSARAGICEQGPGEMRCHAEHVQEDGQSVLRFGGLLRVWQAKVHSRGILHRSEKVQRRFHRKLSLSFPLNVDHVNIKLKILTVAICVASEERQRKGTWNRREEQESEVGQREGGDGEAGEGRQEEGHHRHESRANTRGCHGQVRLKFPFGFFASQLTLRFFLFLVYLKRWKRAVHSAENKRGKGTWGQSEVN